MQPQHEAKLMGYFSPPPPPLPPPPSPPPDFFSCSSVSFIRFPLEQGQGTAAANEERKKGESVKRQQGSTRLVHQKRAGRCSLNPEKTRIVLSEPHSWLNGPDGLRKHLRLLSTARTTPINGAKYGQDATPEYQSGLTSCCLGGTPRHRRD